MKEDTLKIKKGGMDTIVAYIVVMLPLLYVVIYMVATIYHFSVQTYMNQVVKEATMMASTYGQVTEAHAGYIHSKLKGILGEKDGLAKCEIKYYYRPFIEEATGGQKEGVVGEIKGPFNSPGAMGTRQKADIIGISVTSTEPSILHRVTTFDMFPSDEQSTYGGEGDLMYSAYREEIIRNERPE